MKVKMADIPEEGLDLDFDMHTPWAVAAAEQALEGPVQQISGSLRVLRVGPGVHVDGPVTAVTRRTCDRCLGDVRLSLKGRLSLFFERPSSQPELETDLLPEELDIGFLEDDELDLPAVVAEYFALEAPSRIFCDTPGASRMEPGICRLPVEPVLPSGVGDPRLRSLKDVKFD